MANRTENKSTSNNRGHQSAHERLPIKLILPNQGKERIQQGGGADTNPLVPVDEDYRSRLRTEVVAVRRVITHSVGSTGSAPFRVQLRREATAKTHRPYNLFTDITCPIVGAGRLGELFLKGTPKGLNKLAVTIGGNRAKRIVREISTVEVIEPITPQFRRKNILPLDILKRSPRRNNTFVLKVRLFDFGEDQPDLIRDFYTTIKERALTVNQNGYTPSSQVFAIGCKTVADVEALSNIVGVRSINAMPLVSSVRPQALNVRPLPPKLPTAD